MKKNLRGTGRTTRMLEEAKRLAGQKLNVIVVADSIASMRRMQLECKGNSRGITFATCDSPYFNITTLSFSDGRNGIVLVDHHAIEHRLSVALEMLHRFDPAE